MITKNKKIMLLMIIFVIFSGCSTTTKECELPEEDFEYTMKMLDYKEALEKVNPDIDVDIVGTWRRVSSDERHFLNYLICYPNGTIYEGIHASYGFGTQVGEYFTEREKFKTIFLTNSDNATNENKYYISEREYKIIEENGIIKLFLTFKNGDELEYHKVVV